MSSIANSTFDPYAQNITILEADGVTQVIVSLADIDSSAWYNAACSINFGAQCGACGAMFFVVLILSKESKRKTPIFILNMLSLFFGFLRGLLLALYFISPWVDIYPTFAQDFNAIPRGAYATSIAGIVIPLLMTITVNMSLTFQAHTVCKSMRDLHRYIITGLSCLVFLLAVGFRFLEVVTNSMVIVSTVLYYSKVWIAKATLYTETISIWFFSIIFTGKLVFTLYYRRRNGWKQWSGVRILAAMGGCTMVIPSIFAILENLDATMTIFPESGTLALTMVALLMPLSSLWASMAIDAEASTLNLSHLSASQSARSGSDAQRKMFSSQSTTTPSSKLEFLTERKGSLVQINPTTVDSRIESVPPHLKTRDSTEMDLEAMGVRVDKSYSVRSSN